MAFGTIFEYIGGMGLYQIFLFLILSLIPFSGGLQSMAMVFIGPYQDHWCQIDQLLSLPYEQQKKVAIPYDYEDGNYQSCSYYDLNYDNYTTEEFCSWNATSGDVETIECTSWVYDQTQYAKTAVSEYNLVCDRKFLVPIVYSFQILAMFVAVIITGTLSDNFGRKPVLIVGICCQFIFGIVAAFSPNYWLFLMSRTLIAFFLTMGSGYVIATEIVGPQYRAAIGSFYWMLWSVGFMALPFIAFYVTDFRYLQVVLTLLTLPMLTYIFLAPESPRWLVVNGRIDEAEDILRFIAEVNNKSYPEKARSIIMEIDEDEKEEIQSSLEEPKGKYKLFITNSTIRKTYLLIAPAFIVSGIVYYGLSFNVGTLTGNVYFNTFLSGVVEIPANLFAFIFMHVIGRRKTQFLSLSLSGLFCLLCIPFVNNGSSTVVTSLSMVGKAFITISFTTVYLFTTELFPTVVRYIAFGLVEIAASLGGMIAPFMGLPLIAIWEPLPLVIFGILGAITGPLMLVLPETNDKDLPDTVEQAEQMWNKQDSEINVRQIRMKRLSQSAETPEKTV